MESRSKSTKPLMQIQFEVSGFMLMSAGTLKSTEELARVRLWVLLEPAFRAVTIVDQFPDAGVAVELICGLAWIDRPMVAIRNCRKGETSRHL